jgi:poly-gamma-glutamate synthesis protein (capsule biosynthesis protein)
VNIVCILANNHITDYGHDGVLETIHLVQENGFKVVGAGATLAKAREPAVLRFPERTIGILAYADTRYHVGSVAATAHNAGVAPLDPSMVTEDLRYLAAHVDDIWLFLHWGHEYLRYPEPEQRMLARAFSQAGASLIVGMHPHVMRGAEVLERTPVYYSLGNFVFPPIPLVDGYLKKWDHESNQGFVISGKLESQEWNWKAMPYLVSEAGQPQPVELNTQNALRNKIGMLSAPLDEFYAAHYEKLRRREVLLKTARRLGTMSWRERFSLPGRAVQKAILKLARRKSARVYGKR